MFFVLLNNLQWLKLSDQYIQFTDIKVILNNQLVTLFYQ